jgi:hypothetical protein
MLSKNVSEDIKKMKKLLMIAILVGLTSMVALATPVVCAMGASTTFDSATTLALTPSGSCTLGATTFSNFTVYAASGFPATGPSSFSMTIDVDTAVNQLLILYTGLASTQDIHLTFMGSTGITYETLTAGVAVTVSEGICGTAFSISSGTSACGGTLLNLSPLTASNGGSSSSVVTFAPTDFFYKDIAGGSEVIEGVVPEPMTLSLMGAGLLGLGIFGRRRISK